MKMHPLKKSSFLFLLVFFWSSPAHAVLLYDSLIAGGSGNVPANEFGFSLRYDSDLSTELVSTSQLFGFADDGRIIEFLPGESAFDAFAALLTNGIDEAIRFQSTRSNNGTFVSGSASSQSESSKFNPNFSSVKVPRINGIDYEGFTIDRITLSLEELGFRNVQNQTGYTFLVSWQIYGEPLHSAVPEPSTLLLLASGGLLGRRLKRKSIA